MAHTAAIAKRKAAEAKTAGKVAPTEQAAKAPLSLTPSVAPKGVDVKPKTPKQPVTENDVSRKSDLAKKTELAPGTTKVANQVVTNQQIVEP